MVSIGLLLLLPLSFGLSTMTACKHMPQIGPAVLNRVCTVNNTDGSIHARLNFGRVCNKQTLTSIRKHIHGVYLCGEHDAGCNQILRINP
jgi:hypothetical protein